MSMKTLSARLDYNGGNALGRINRQKLRSLQAALKDDYQTRFIKTPLHSSWPCIINSKDLKSDYDKEMISVEFDSGLEPGDVFEILDDNTHWMIYLPVITETAYLRAQIIRCRYQLEIDGENFWIYFQGPTETDLRWYIKSGINYNELNLSGTIYIKNTPKTKEYFKRFTHLKIDGHTWEVQVTDSITVPGIIELEIQEYYDNPILELPTVTKENEIDQIIGKTLVKQNEICGYDIQDIYYNTNYSWSIEDNPRVRIVDIFQDGQTCSVKIEPGAIGDFMIYYGDRNNGFGKKVTIDFEESPIQGPDELYPYDTQIYTTKIPGVFWLQTELAEILNQGDTWCDLEVKTGRKGSFDLYFRAEGNKSDDYISFPIKIKSF